MDELDQAIATFLFENGGIKTVTDNGDGTYTLHAGENGTGNSLTVQAV
jgi:hypothetical protein